MPQKKPVDDWQNVDDWEEVNSPAKPTAQPSQGDTYKGPDTFWGGVADSLNPFGGGQSLSAAARGGLGWLKGATIDLPSSIMGGLETIGNAITDPVGTVKSIPQGLSNMWDTTLRAGSDPDSFGRMVGQATGQPLTTYGLSKAAPMLKAPIGKVIEPVGSTMRRYQPISGFLPRLAEGRTLRNIERMAGGGLEKLGQRMQQPSVPTVDAVPFTPDVMEGSFTEAPPVAPQGPAQLPPSNVGYYHPESFPEQAPSPMPQVPQEFMDSVMPQAGPKALPPSPIGYFMEPPTDLGAQSPTAASHMNSPATPHGIPEAPPEVVPPPAPIPKETRVVPKKVLNNNTLTQLKQQGFEITGMNDKGDFILSK